MSPAAGWLRLAGVALAVTGLDQLTKAVVVASIDRGDAVEVLPFLDLVHVKNEGIAFGFLGDGSKELVLIVTLVALLAVMGWFAWNPARPWAWLAIGLLAGGAIGNLVDRAARGGVVDFIDLPAWPSFNVADVAITAGAFILALSAFAAGDADGEDRSDTDRDEPAETARGG